MKSERVKQLQPVLGWLKSLWQERAPRDQQVMQWLGLVLAVFLLYTLFWQPLMQARIDARSHYVSAHQTHDWMLANAAAIEQTRTSDNRTLSSDWVMNINQSAAAAGLALKGFTPQGSNSVRVVLEKQPFSAVLVWFETLKQASGVLPAT